MEKSYNKENLQELEKKLKENGYKELHSGLSSTETYGWFKSIKDDDGELRYMIEFRIWDFTAYAHRDTFIDKAPYSVDVLILYGGSNSRLDLEITTPLFDIKTTEELANELTALLDKYVKQVS